MKTIGRALVILFAALLVAGAVYGLQSAGLLGSADGGRPAGAVVGQGAAPAGEFTPGAGRGPRGGHHEQAGASGAIEIAKNLAIIAVIVTLVAGGAALFRWLRPARRDREPPLAV